MLFSQATPPQCKLDQMRVPIALFYGSDDWLVVPEDINRLIQLLPNIVTKRNIDGWTHLDFIFGLGAAGDLYEEIVNLIQKREV